MELQPSRYFQLCASEYSDTFYHFLFLDGIFFVVVVENKKMVVGDPNF